MRKSAWLPFGSRFVALSLGLLLNYLLLTGYNWPQFNGDSQHSGSNTQERFISPENVSRLKLLYQVNLPGVADGSPIYLSAVSTPAGTKNLLYMTTRQGHILAVEAETGSIVWEHQIPAGKCVYNEKVACITTSSPAIDPNLKYVYSYGLDGYVHKYQVGDGTEINDWGWPELVTLKNDQEKGSSALTVATARNGSSYLYVVSSGYPGDFGDYQGHLTTINLLDGSQKVFNALCSQQTVHFMPAPATPDCSEKQAGVWGRSGVTYDIETDRIYLATGNGHFDPGNHLWGDSVLALNPDGSGLADGPVDSYTPADYQHLNSVDLDLGSTSPAILPVPVGRRLRHLGLQGGKDGFLRLLDLDNLSGMGEPGQRGGELAEPIHVPQGGMLRNVPCVWINPADGTPWVFVATDNEDGSPPVGLAAFKLVVDQASTPKLTLVWKNDRGGTSPLIANQVLFYASSGSVIALDPLTGTQLWSSTDQFIFNIWHDSAVREIHWESPIVANGLLFMPDNRGNLLAYGIDAFDSQTQVGRIFLISMGGGICIALAYRTIKRKPKEK